MKAQIKSVAINVASKKDGRIVNLITLNNGTVIVRDTKQFNADLKGSFLRARQVKDLIGGTVSGDFKYHKQGDKYIANEFTKVSGAKEGDELEYSSDGYRVEGFLTLEVSAKADQADRNAMANAELMAEIMGYSAEEPVAHTEAIVEEEFIPTI